MAIVYPNLSYIPQINAPTGSLIYQSASKINRTEYGMDTRTRRYLGFLPYYQTLAEAFIDTLDPDFPGLQCIAWTATEGEVSAIIEFQYKGLATGNNNVFVIKPPYPVNDVSLQSASVQDNGFNSGDPSQPTSVWFQYYAPQTTWRWVSITSPTAPTYTAVINDNFNVQPFNTYPPTPISDLNYTTQSEVTHFHSEPAGNYWDCEATTAIQIIPQDIIPIG